MNHPSTAALLWLASAWAAAAEPCRDYHEDVIARNASAAEEVYPLLSNERERGCILGRTDTTGIESRYQELLRGTLTPEGQATARTLLLEALIADFEELPSRICNEPAPECVVGRHTDALHRLQRRLERGELEVVTESLNDWAPQTFDGRIDASSVVLADFLDAQCASGVKTQACATAVTIAAKVMRSGIAVSQLIAAYRLPIVGVNEAFLSGRDREWESYLNEPPVQYPWELAVNGWRFRRESEDQDRFPRAPNDQWVLLHPSPAAEMIDTPLGDSTTAAAIVLEVVGYQRWQWYDGRRRNRWGVSAVVSVADISGMNTFGYGAMIHTPFPHASLGVVRRGGRDGSETGIVLSLDLAAMVQQYRNGDLRWFLGL